MRPFALFLALYACLPAQVSCREYHRVAVLPFVCEEVREDLAWVGEGVALMVSDRLAETGRVRILDPSRFRSMASAGEDPADLRSLGRSLKAGLVIAGTCRESGRRFRVTFHMVTVQPDLHFAEEVTTDADHLQGAAGKIARRGMEALGVKLPADREKRLLREDGQGPGLLPLLVRAAAAPTAEARCSVYEEAAESGSSTPALLVRMGDSYLASGRFREAEGAYLRALVSDPGNLLATNNLGVLRLRQERFDEAVARFRSVCDTEPAFSDGWYNLGLAYQGLGADSTAAGAYARASSLEPEHTAARLNLGVLFARHGQFGQASAHFEQAMREDPGSLSARLNLASALAKQGLLDSAAAAFEEVLRLRPGDGRARAGLAEVRVSLADRYLEAKRPAEAERECRVAAELDSMQWKARLGLSLALEARGDTLGSLREAEQAARLSPGEPSAHLQLGNANVAAGRSDRALEAYRAATGLDAALEPAWRNLGAALIDAGRPAEAVPALLKALALQPESAETRANLGLAYLRQGDYPSAATAYAEASRLKPADPRLSLRLGFAWSLAENQDSARAAFDRAAALSPSPGRIYSEVGAFLEGRKRTSEAVAALRKAVSLDPGLTEARRRLGLLLESVGDRGAAIRQLSEAARQEPEYPGVWAHLGALYADQGDLLKAAEAYRQAGETDTAHTDAYRYNAGLLLLKSQRGAEAQRLLSRAVSETPGSGLGHLLLARADMLANRQGEAVEAYRKALGLGFRPEDGVHVGKVRVELGRALQEAGRLDEAVEVCRAAVREDSRISEGRILLGDLYAQQDRYDLAISEYERALKIDPACRGVYYALGRACQQRGDLSGAIRHLRAYLASDPGREEEGRIMSARRMLDALLQEGR